MSIKQAFIYGGLFILTLITTTLSGGEWAYSSYFFQDEYTWIDFQKGFAYSIPFLCILSAHEFGHYFAAVWHRVKTSLPYYIPFYLPFLPYTLGTLGAIIRLRERPKTTTKQFDIGVAGPLSGFVVALFFLVYGFTHLPESDYIFTLHPEYEQYGQDYAQYVYSPDFSFGNTDTPVVNIRFGKNLLFLFFEHFVADPERVPNAHELMHFPLLFAGFLSMVFTALNLLPIGQLDGGHIIYGLIGGKGHRMVASSALIMFLFYAGLGYVLPQASITELLVDIPLMIGLYYLSLSRMGMSTRNTIMVAVLLFTVQLAIAAVFPFIRGYSGWLLMALIIGRFIGVHHPRSEVEEELTLTRKIIAGIALFIFVITFTPRPIEIELLNENF